MFDLFITPPVIRELKMNANVVVEWRVFLFWIRGGAQLPRSAIHVNISTYFITRDDTAGAKLIGSARTCHLQAIISLLKSKNTCYGSNNVHNTRWLCLCYFSNFTTWLSKSCIALAFEIEFTIAGQQSRGSSPWSAWIGNTWKSMVCRRRSKKMEFSGTPPKLNVNVTNSCERIGPAPRCLCLLYAAFRSCFQFRICLPMFMCHIFAFSYDMVAVYIYMY